MTDPNGDRVATVKITFKAPFRLGKCDDLLPAGSYDVETTEAAHHGLERTAYVRTRTVLIVPSATGRSYREVDPLDLQAALDRDGSVRLDPATFLTSFRS